jgi:hypothetical protein
MILFGSDQLTSTALQIPPMTPAAVDALLAESTKVAGWPQSDVLWWLPTKITFELRGALANVADAVHRELLISAGASLLNLRLLIRVLGLHAAVQLLPDPQQPELIAIVRPQGVRVITSLDRLLAAGIVQGSASAAATQSTTVPSAGSPALPANLLGLVQRAAKIEHGWAAMIPAEALPLPIEAQLGCDGAPVAIIGTVLDSPAARLQAGQAMQRVLLTATVNGVAARPCPAVLSSPESRAAVRQLMGGGLWPQAVLRLASAASRKPAD